MAMSLFQRLHVPRWGVYQHAELAQSLAHRGGFTAVVVHGQQVLTHTGLQLTRVMSELLQTQALA